MTKIIFLAAAFLACSSAFADYSGTWVGTDGQAIGPGTVTASCTSIQFHVTQSATSLIVDAGAYTCGSLSANATTMTFDISGTDLMMQGQKVGMLTPTTVSYTLTAPGSGYVTMNFSATADGEAFTQHLVMAGMTVDVTANLKNQ